MTSLTVQNLDLNKNTQAAKYSRATEKEQASKELATYFGSSVSQNSNHDNVKFNSKSKAAPQTKQNDNDKFVVAGSILGTGIVSGFIVGGPFGGLVGGILAGSTLLFTSCSSDEKKSTAAPAKKQVTKPKTNGMRQIFKSNKVKITPACVYTIAPGDNFATIAKKYRVSPTRLQQANPNVTNHANLKVGQKINIPESVTVDTKQIRSLNDVAEAVGVSQDFITNFIENIETLHLKAYNDKVNGGTWTIGYGHTGEVKGKKINANTTISKKEALELLAVDLLNAKIEALAYFGNDFLKAPQSVQDGIVDNAFNKGIEGFTENSSSPTYQVKDDLKRKDYASAAAHLVYKTDNRGLKKRVLYRVIYATKNLTPADRKKSLNINSVYYNEVLKKFNTPKDTTEVKYMKAAWNNAQKGVYKEFMK